MRLLLVCARSNVEIHRSLPTQLARYSSRRIAPGCLPLSPAKKCWPSIRRMQMLISRIVLLFHTTEWFPLRRQLNWTVYSIYKWPNQTLLSCRRWCPIQLVSMAEKRSFFLRAFAQGTLGNTNVLHSDQLLMVLIDDRSQLRKINSFHSNRFKFSNASERLTSVWINSLFLSNAQRFIDISFFDALNAQIAECLCHRFWIDFDCANAAAPTMTSY